MLTRKMIARATATDPTRNTLSGLGLSVLLLLPGGATAGVGTTVTPVVVGGQTAPGTGGGVFSNNLATFGVPRVNAAGHIAFSANLAQSGSVTSANDFGIWAGPISSLAIATREGDLAAGAGSAVYGAGQNLLVLGGGGHIAARNNLTGPGVVTSGTTANSVAIWSGIAGSLGLLARENAPAPGLGSAVFGVGAFTSASMVVNQTGQSAFFANLRTAVGGVTAANDRTLWSGTPGSIALVAREGDSAPGTAGAGFSTLSTTLAMNTAGSMVFAAALTGGDTISGVNSSGLWVGPAGGLSLVVRQGDAAPGTGGAVFGSANEPTINSSGRVMFRAGLSGGGVSAANDAGLWSGVPGSLALIARKGDAAPGVSGGVFTGVGIGARLYSGPDRVVFRGLANDGGASDLVGLWHGTPGSIAKIAVTGDTVPGVVGASFDSTFSGISANAMGQVAFTALFTGAGIDSTNNLGLFTADSSGGLDLLLRTGDLFDANADAGITDLRTISGIELAGGAALTDGAAAAFNDDGLLVFRLNFTNGTQAIVTASIPIPAPGVATLLAAASMLVIRRKR